MFLTGEIIQLSPTHLSVCIGEFEKVKLLDTNMEIIDRAFEYLLPDVAKVKRTVFYTSSCY